MASSQPTIIILVRHAQTDWNVTRRWQGHLDIPLNATGRSQARAVAKRLSTWPLAAVYSSDLSRAADTALAIGGAHSQQPVYDRALRERHGGLFQGQTLEELEAAHGDFWHSVRFDGQAPPGGESNLEVAQRVKGFYERILAAHPGQMVAVVSHGGVMNILLGYVLGLPLGQRAPVSLRGNTGLTIIEIKDERPRLTLLNDVCHLTDEITGS